jgi:hypothetical protein
MHICKLTDILIESWIQVVLLTPFSDENPGLRKMSDLPKQGKILSLHFV